jgi:hypothetical protein
MPDMPTFTEQLGESLKGDERLSQWLSTAKEAGRDGNLSDFVTDHFSLGDAHTKLKGDTEGMVRIPGEDSSDEDRTSFRGNVNKFLGVPENVAGYEITKPNDLPEGMEYDDTLSDKMLETLHKHNAPKELVHALFGTFNEYHAGLQTEFNTFRKDASEKDLNSLKELWGDGFEQKNRETFEVLSRMAEKIKIPDSIGGIEGFKSDLESLALTNNPRFNVLFNSLFEKLGDPELLFGNPSKEALDEGDTWYPSMKKAK